MGTVASGSRSTPSRWWRLVLPAFGGLVALLGLFLPRGWYDPLPQRELIPGSPTIGGLSGLSLLKTSLVVEGLVLIWFGLRGGFSRLDEEDRLAATPPEGIEAISSGQATWLLAAVTALGLALRLVGLDNDLWLDEITPLVDYRHASALQVATSYISSNNHLLNTLLIKLVVSLLGEREWTVRLPAVLFGVATIPAIYWVARHAVSRTASLGTALVLAVSYHHIFFSQNARGYTAYLLFSLLAAPLLLRGLQSDRPATWMQYVLVMWLAFASNLISVFVLAAHVLVGLGALCAVRRPGVSAWPIGRRLVGVFAVTGFLGFQLYAVALPQIHAYMKSVYADPAAGYPPLSLDLLREISRGVTAGFGPGLLVGVVPFLLIATAGLLSLVRRCWPVALGLVLPPVLHVVFVVGRDLIASPRFFLLGLPLALMASVRGIDLLTRRLGQALALGQTFQATTATALVFAVAFATLLPLPGYYAVPKQPYRRSIQFVEAMRTPDDVVIVVYLAEHGYRYYVPRGETADADGYLFIRSLAALERILVTTPGKRAIVVTTFPRALRVSAPDLDARLRRDWRVVQTFPATVGDGAISVWLPAAPGAPG